MRISNLTTLLRARPGHLPVFLRDKPVTGVETVAGRIRRSVMGSSFLVLPDKPRDEVITPATTCSDEQGRLPILRTRDLIGMLAAHDQDREMFIDEEPVDGFEEQRGRITTSGQEKRFAPDAVGGRQVTLAFTRWMELSDGTRHLIAF